MYFHRLSWLKKIALLLLVLSSVLFSNTILAEQEQETLISEAELAQTLAPIALYPDTLLTHILIASTYPLEVIAAERWLNKHESLSKEQIVNKGEDKDWDASVKALLVFPKVMAKLSEDLNWMQKLGDAFLQDEARVLASIQTLRQQADQAGSLADMSNVKIVKEQKVIIIEPVQPEVIYVPYYDSRVVYGYWHWSHYPPVYWHHPHHYAAHYGHFYWGHGVHISSHFFFSAFHWHNRHIVVSHYNRHGYHPRKKIVTSHHAKRWSHQVKHRRGVAYSSGRLKQKYYGTGPRVYRNKAVASNKVSKNNVRTIHSRSKNSLSNSTNRKSVHHNSQVKVHKSSANKHRLTNNKPIKQTVKPSSNKQSVASKHQTQKQSAKHSARSLPKQYAKQSSKQYSKARGTVNKQHRTKHH